jgi:hypothetical protein
LTAENLEWKKTRLHLFFSSSAVLDINMMLLGGFGFLMTFLKRFRFILICNLFYLRRPFEKENKANCTKTQNKEKLNATSREPNAGLREKILVVQIF